MASYTIRTDAVMMRDVEAESLDAAIAKFARSEGMRARTADEIREEIEQIDDGAWLWADCDGERVLEVGPQPGSIA